MEENYPPGPPENLITEGDYVDLHQASPGRRLANYLIDYGVVYITWRFVFFKPAVTLLTAIYEQTESRVAMYVFTYIMVLGWSLLYKAGMESLCNGKTLGKFVTGTRAVNEDGTKIPAKTALLRALSRLVPFEVFSALSNTPPYPWHDRWTHTYVIDEKTSTLNY